MLFSRAKANVTVFCNRNNGKLINRNCGATNTSFLLEKMKQGDYSLGFALDGDADRLAVVENNVVVPNSKVFFAMARYLSEKGRLRNNTVCGTVLTNGGVESALNGLGIRLLRSDVGDTNVFNTMVKEGLNFGGEQSGHYLLCDYTTSSDALINALFLCKIYREKGSLLKYASQCVEITSVSKNIPHDGKQHCAVRRRQIAKHRRTCIATVPRLPFGTSQKRHGKRGACLCRGGAGAKSGRLCGSHLFAKRKPPVTTKKY